MSPKLFPNVVPGVAPRGPDLLRLSAEPRWLTMGPAVASAATY